MPTADERLHYTSPPVHQSSPWVIDSEVLSERMFVLFLYFRTFIKKIFFLSFFFCALLCIMTGPTSPILGSLALLGGLLYKGPDFRLTFLNTPFS